MVPLIGTGDTVAEAKSDFMNSIKEIIESYKEDAQPVPVELTEEPEGISVTSGNLLVGFANDANIYRLEFA